MAEEGNQQFPCQLVLDLVHWCGKIFDWVRSNAWPWCGGGSPVGAGEGPGALVRPSVLTGNGFTLGLGAFGCGGSSCT